MGQLKFDISLTGTQRLMHNIISVVGKWYLTRSIGDLWAATLLCYWKKIKNKWVIVCRPFQLIGLIVICKTQILINQ
jgi:hypothetical protein